MQAMASNAGFMRMLMRSGTCELAAELLRLADEEGLGHLRAVALDFIVHHYERVAGTAAYASLTKCQTDLVASEACAFLARMRSVLSAVAAPSGEIRTTLRGFPDL